VRLSFLRKTGLCALYGRHLRTLPQNSPTPAGSQSATSLPNPLPASPTPNKVPQPRDFEKAGRYRGCPADTGAPHSVPTGTLWPSHTQASPNAPTYRQSTNAPSKRCRETLGSPAIKGRGGSPSVPTYCLSPHKGTPPERSGTPTIKQPQKGVRFEPTEPLAVRTISSRAPSSRTKPPN